VLDGPRETSFTEESAPPVPPVGTSGGEGTDGTADGGTVVAAARTGEIVDAGAIVASAVLWKRPDEVERPARRIEGTTESLDLTALLCPTGDAGVPRRVRSGTMICISTVSIESGATIEGGVRVTQRRPISNSA
jgi:hypothetical protein